MLTKFIPDGAIRVPLATADSADVTKAGVIEELVGLLPESADPAMREQILKAVLHREQQMSTGIGEGVAIPHGTAAIGTDLIIAAGLATEPGVDFAAIDKKPARIFFLLIAKPEQRATHLQALARIARLMKSENTYDRLLAATDAAAFRAVLADAESAES